MKKKWPLWKKLVTLLLIALYFGVIFSIAYGYRLKQTDTVAYEALIAKVEIKLTAAKDKISETSGFFWEKTTEAASNAKDSILETASAIKDKAAKTLKESLETKSDVYAQAPDESEMISSPVNDLVDASYDTTETHRYQDEFTGETMLTGGPFDILYYNQTDPRWKDKFYGGHDTIGKYGCGPTALAMAVSSITEQTITPDAMAVWARENGYFCNGSGSYHSLIPEGAAKFGLTVEKLGTPSSATVIEALCTGKIIVALMSQGHFTNSGHFVLVRGVTLDGKILLADPLSLDNSLKAWDLDILMNELKRGAASGGPVWAISK